MGYDKSKIKFTYTPCDPFKVICIDDEIMRAEIIAYKNVHGVLLPYPIKDNTYTVISSCNMYFADTGLSLHMYIFSELDYEIFGERASWNHIFFTKPETDFAEQALETAITEGKQLEQEMLIPVKA